MYICIPDVLTRAQLGQMSNLLKKQHFLSSQKTGLAAATVKSSSVMSGDSPDYLAMHELVIAAVTSNRQFCMAAIPLRFRPTIFARYLLGTAYGKHIDNPVMGQKQPMRADLSFTLFLSPPESYEGGELVVDEPGGERSFKLPAGSMILYPCNTLHQVTEVTSGCRDVALGWVQSMVRDPSQRRIIYELEELRTNMFAKSGKSSEFDVISRNVSDLWRMWVEV